MIRQDPLTRSLRSVAFAQRVIRQAKPAQTAVRHVDWLRKRRLALARYRPLVPGPQPMTLLASRAPRVRSPQGQDLILAHPVVTPSPATGRGDRERLATSQQAPLAARPTRQQASVRLPSVDAVREALGRDAPSRPGGEGQRAEPSRERPARPRHPPPSQVRPLPRTAPAALRRGSGLVEEPERSEIRPTAPARGPVETNQRERDISEQPQSREKVLEAELPEVVPQERAEEPVRPFDQQPPPAQAPEAPQPIAAGEAEVPVDQVEARPSPEDRPGAPARSREEMAAEESGQKPPSDLAREAEVSGPQERTEVAETERVQADEPRLPDQQITLAGPSPPTLRARTAIEAPTIVQEPSSGQRAAPSPAREGEDVAQRLADSGIIFEAPIVQRQESREALPGAEPGEQTQTPPTISLGPDQVDVGGMVEEVPGEHTPETPMPGPQRESELRRRPYEFPDLQRRTMPPSAEPGAEGGRDATTLPPEVFAEIEAESAYAGREPETEPMALTPPTVAREQPRPVQVPAVEPEEPDAARSQAETVRRASAGVSSEVTPRVAFEAPSRETARREGAESAGAQLPAREPEPGESVTTEGEPSEEPLAAVAEEEALPIQPLRLDEALFKRGGVLSHVQTLRRTDPYQEVRPSPRPFDAARREGDPVLQVNLIQRVADTASAARPATEAPGEEAPPGAEREGTGEVDLARLTEEVYSRIRERLRVERERYGSSRRR